MGRFRRKKHTLKGEDGDGAKKGNSSTIKQDFSSKEKDRICRYLAEFRSGARKFMKQQGCVSEANVTNSSGRTRRDPTKQAITVAEIELPELTEEVFRTQKYLKLPAGFSLKKRQFIHDCCVELGIYHCGIGQHKTRERYIAISIYCDVFEEIEGFSRPDYLDLYRSISPWFCRHEIASSRDETTDAFRQRIQSLIDQPGTCLRDGIDVLDFASLDGKDLSTVQPPGFKDGDAEIGQFDTNWILVDTADKMKKCIEELECGGLTELAFDIEAYNLSKYSQLTCLLQLTSNLGTEYVVDPLAPGVWDEVCGLAPIFANPAIIKVGHSIGGLDARCLHRDFGIFICNAFDTYEASKVLNLPSHGLAAVCQHYGLTHSSDYADLKGVYQTTDWRQRPLSKKMILYGRYDVHYLLKLRLLMMRDLTHNEFFADDYDESKLVAESLAATLKRIQAYEDGDDFFDQLEDGSTYLSIPDENENDRLKNESVERAGTDFGANGQGDFYTPMQTQANSFSNESRDTIMESVAVADQDENFHDTHDVKATKLAAADVLRMQPRLMRVITLSQERCKDVWTGRPEPHYRNPMFVALMQRAKRLQKTHHQAAEPLSKSQIQLYEDLVRLRAYIAQRDECLPGFVCSLSDLALIAAKRPTNVEALRLINYFLPEIIGSGLNDAFVKQIFVLTRASLTVDGVDKSPADMSVCRYYVEAEHISPTLVWSAIKKVTGLALVSAIFGGIIFATLAITRRRRK